MDFTIKDRINKNDEKYHIQNLKVAREFSKKVLEELENFVKSIVIFGSNSKDTQNKDSDIDIMIVLDNISVFVTAELREAYRIITAKLNKELADNKIHLFTLNLSDLFEMSIKSDPILINILRYGYPLFDRDVFEPFKYLLEIGKLRPSIESINQYTSRASRLLDDTKKHIEYAILDLYYCVVDIIHATLMAKNILPPSPKEMPELFEKTFNRNPKIKKYSKTIKKFYAISKEIEHKKEPNLSGVNFDKLYNEAKTLVVELSKYNNSQIKKKGFFKI